MKSGISEIIGQAIFDGGSKSAVYRALRPLVCASCGVLIAAGEIFTRTKTEEQAVRLWPRCRTCAPFTLQLGKQARSPLLESLLALPAAKLVEEDAQNDRASATQAEDKRQKILTAMRQRLGPALERARRSRSGKR